MSWYWENHQGNWYVAGKQTQYINGTCWHKWLNKTSQITELIEKNPEKCSKISPSTELVFSEISLKKDKAGLDKIQKESNGRLKIFCLQKWIPFIQPNNLDE